MVPLCGAQAPTQRMNRSVTAALPSLSGSGPETDHDATRLLLWLSEQSEGRVGVPVPCADFGYRRALPGDMVLHVVSVLERSGMVHLHETRPDGPVVSLLEGGVRHVTRLQDRREDVAERNRYTQRALLDWIFARSDRTELRIQEFFDSEEVLFLGEPLREGDVAATAAYLERAGLIACEGPEFVGRVRSLVSLTALGGDAANSSDPVDRYLEGLRERRRPAQGDTIVNGPVFGTLVTGDVHGGFAAHQSTSPQDAAQLVRSLAPVLARDQQQLDELLRAADSLEEASTAPPGTPAETTRERRRGPLRRVRELLQSSPDTVGRQLALNTLAEAAKLLG